MDKTSSGFTLHMGRLLGGTLLAIGGVFILAFFGWQSLWVLPAALIAIWMLVAVIDLVENRFLMVTPEHVARGVPPRCTRCEEDWDVVLRRASDKMRCPICGHREKGRLAVPN